MSRRKIRLTVSLGFVGADHVEEVDLPEDWDEMTQEEQAGFVEAVLDDFVADKVESWSEIVGDEDGDE